jgi:thioredoxin reductase (NADPH)
MACTTEPVSRLPRRWLDFKSLWSVGATPQGRRCSTWPGIAYLVNAISARPVIKVHLNTEVIGGHGNGQLESITVRDRTSSQEQQIPLASLFVMIGARPRTDWLPPNVERDPYGFLSTGTDAAMSDHWNLARQPHPHETTVPGLFAVGDVRRGSIKRVASAVGEGSVVVSEIHEFLATPQG